MNGFSGSSFGANSIVTELPSALTVTSKKRSFIVVKYSTRFWMRSSSVFGT